MTELLQSFLPCYIQPHIKSYYLMTIWYTNQTVINKQTHTIHLIIKTLKINKDIDEIKTREKKLV